MRSLLVLMFGNFVIGTGALAFIGMLDTVADDLRVTPAAAGQIAGLYSLGICLSGPLLGALTSRFERRQVLTASLVLFGVGHAAATVAAGYWSLLAFRVATAFAGTLFTPQAAATVGLLVPPERRARSIAFVFVGWSISAVFGMPFGAWSGAHYGWRPALWIVAALSLLAAAAVYGQLPRGLYVGRIDAAAWRAVAAHPVLLRVVSVTAVQASAQFTLFSYLVIAYRDAIGATPNVVALLLFAQGSAGVFGNLAAGALADRLGPARVVQIAIGLMFGGVSVWVGAVAAGPGALGLALALASALIWGSGSFSSNSMQQVRLVNTAPPLAAVSVALNTSAIYLGQFIGAGIGGLVLSYAWATPRSSALPWVSLPILALAIWISAAAQRRAEALAGSLARAPALQR